MIMLNFDVEELAMLMHAVNNAPFAGALAERIIQLKVKLSVAEKQQNDSAQPKN
jgi:hypothetical protein